MIKKPEGPFEIRINEEQRGLLVSLIQAALKNAEFCGELAAVKMESCFDNQLKEAEVFLDMLQDLPEQNEECSPGESFSRRRVLHGFCL